MNYEHFLTEYSTTVRSKGYYATLRGYVILLAKNIRRSQIEMEQLVDSIIKWDC